MNNIISITGHPRSGHLDLAFKLCKNSSISFVKAYTNRPVNDLWSDCYNFVSDLRLEELMRTEEILYESMVNGYYYVFFKKQLTDSYNVLILDDYGVAECRSKYINNFYSIKCTSKNQGDSDRVGVYMYDHEFDKIFHYEKDSLEELEWEIESNLPLR